jgi:hypothetical protein
MGGGMKYSSSSSSSSFSLSSSSFYDCSSSSFDGKGGGIYLDLSLPYSSLFLSSLSFYSNIAKVGEDLYLLSSFFLSLFTSPPPSSPFSFAVRNGVSRRFSLFGKEVGEGKRFNDEIDLYVFILGYRSSPFFLSSSSSQNNIFYCGMSLLPCFSLPFLLERDFFT